MLYAHDLGEQCGAEPNPSPILLGGYGPEQLAGPDSMVFFQDENILD